jgi:putative acetyltransferase
MLHVHHIQIRREQPGDESAIGRVHDEAFGQPVESRIVDAVRRAGHSAISLVAVDGPDVVGHILFTPVSIEADGPRIDALGLGPMSVSTRLQRRGIGSKLVEAGLRECAQAGCEVVVVIGHPQFYPRFGFRPGGFYGLRLRFEVPDEAFMVRELKADALAGRSGLVKYIPEFET